MGADVGQPSRQWGPPATKDFLSGSTPPLQTIRHLVSALADPTNEFDLTASTAC